MQGEPGGTTEGAPLCPAGGTTSCLFTSGMEGANGGGASRGCPARGCPSGPEEVRQDPQTRVTAGGFQNIHSSKDFASRTFILNMLHCPSAFNNVFTGSDMAAKS